MAETHNPDPRHARRAIGLWIALGCLLGLLAFACTGCGATPTPLATPSTQAPAPVPSQTRIPPTSTSIPTSPPSSTPSPSPSPTATAPATAVTPSPETSTAVPQAPSPAPTTGAPVIHYFTVDPEVAAAGDTVALSWASSGATNAVLYKLFYSGQLSPDGWDVPTTGFRTYTIDPDEVNWVSFYLYVWNSAQRHADASTTVELRCSYNWFFQPPPEDLCPAEPVVSPAAEQAFERGTMIWVESEDAIYVLYGEEQVYPKWDRYTDEWNEGEPDRDPDLEPPPGRYQPIRGFGLIWRENSYVREHLGWAIEPETAHTTVMQGTTRYNYNAWYILARDGMVWYLGPEGSSWSKITPGQ